MTTTTPRRTASGFTHERSRGKSCEHYTPARLLDTLGASFDLDPASPGAAHTAVPATTHYALHPLGGADPVGKTTVHADGLATEWPSGAYVWLNPPYDRESLPAFLAKMAAHDHGIALTFARTDTRWWHESVAGRARSVLFIRGRLAFDTPDGPQGTAPAPSVLIAYGTRAHADLSRVARRGLGDLLTTGSGQATSTVQALRAA